MSDKYTFKQTNLMWLMCSSSIVNRHALQFAGGRCWRRTYIQMDRIRRSFPGGRRQLHLRGCRRCAFIACSPHTSTTIEHFYASSCSAAMLSTLCRRQRPNITTSPTTEQAIKSHNIDYWFYPKK